MDQAEKQRIQQAVKRRSRALDAVRDQQIREHMAMSVSQRLEATLELANAGFDLGAEHRHDDVIWRKWQRARAAWHAKYDKPSPED